MKYKFFLLFNFWGLLLISQPLEIDLRDPITDFTLSIKDNVDYTLVIKNMDTSNSYTISVEVSNVERAPLSSTPVSNSTEKASGLSEKRIHLGKLKKDQIVAVIIIETDASGKKKTWNYKYKTPTKGKWITTFGYSAIVDILKKRTYYLEGTNSIFTIRKDRSPEYIYYTPSVMFTWVGTKYDRYTFSWTAGLGLDFSNPTLFIGGGVRYYENIGLDIGVSLHRKKFLNGSYKEDQELKEFISDEALHKLKYIFNPFLSLSLRLDKNPFTKTVEN
ncbi:MAG: hypothetical protein IPG12_05730 [Saprospiraceae bacterium]|nr:hypothetical protein [Saprospiraceae bacterium]